MLGPRLHLKAVLAAWSWCGYQFAQAVKALNAPIVYFDAQGQMIDPWTQQPRPGMDDGAIARMAAAFVSRGARAGTEGTLMAEFMADVSGYFSTQLRR